MKKKILICGGHVTPALALMDELGDYDIVFVGRTYAVEYSLVTKKGIRFISINAGKSSWSAFFKTPVGFLQAILLLLFERPQVVVSFGGYVALPVSLVAGLFGIPVVTHEQTLSPGRANRIIAKIAKKVCVAFPEIVDAFPKEKVVYTGLPMRKELFANFPVAPFSIDENKYPILYITGGSQGAQSVNDMIFAALPELTKSYTVIHQTGQQSIDEANKIMNDRYFPKAFIEESSLAWILHHAKLVISRSGANTTMELAALGKVAILIPLPWSAGNEQLLQAKWLAAHGGAVVLEQTLCTADVLYETVQKMNEAYQEYDARAKKFAKTIPRDGAAKFVKEVRALL